MKLWIGRPLGPGDTIMLFIVLGIAVFAAVSGLLFVSHANRTSKKDYLYDESDAFDQRQFKKWRF
jgi:hypothetical protein